MIPRSLERDEADPIAGQGLPRRDATKIEREVAQAREAARLAMKKRDVETPTARLRSACLRTNRYSHRSMPPVSSK